MQDDFGDIPIPPVSDEDLAKLKKEYSEGKIMGGKWLESFMYIGLRLFIDSESKIQAILTKSTTL